MRSVVGFALDQAQLGPKHRGAKPPKGVRAEILELASRNDGDTYRAVFEVRFRAYIYELHTCQKKAERGIESPLREIELAKRRLNPAHCPVTCSKETGCASGTWPLTVRSMRWYRPIYVARQLDLKSRLAALQS